MVSRSLVPLLLAFSGILAAQPAFFPLKDVRAGMHGTGRTVFSGDRVEEFQVEILGVLDNFGPKESLILARLSGGPLEHTGVMEGMSGSPVYIDGKLVGAVAMAFPFAKDPIGGIRPIEEMVRATSSLAENSQPSPRRPAVALFDRDLTRSIARPEPVTIGENRMVEIATPLSFSGFTRATIDAFAPQLRALGLEPRQAITSGGPDNQRMGNPADLKPGSMVTVELLSGDLSMGASGTVTYIDGNKLYAFGHRFMGIGETALPFALGNVVTLLPNVNTSFKLVTAKDWMGAIGQDRDTAIAGEIGKRVPLAPVSFRVTRNGRPVQSYDCLMVNDPLLSPILLQMAVFSTVDSTERALGAGSIRVSGDIEFQNSPAPVHVNNVYSADNGVSTLVALSTAIPLAYVMGSEFRQLALKKISLQIDASDQKKQWSIDSVIASRREIKAGEKVQLSVLLTGENGAETIRRFDYQAPIGTTPGPLFFTVSDATTANLSDFRQTLTSSPRSVAQLIGTVNGLHPNNKLYVRVWRAEPAFQLDGADLPDPPASAYLVLTGSSTSSGGITQTRNSKIGELELDGGDMVISGVKTIQVDIKE